MIVSSGSPKNLTLLLTLLVNAFIWIISLEVTLQESSSNKPASLAQSPKTTNCLNSSVLWPIKETKGRVLWAFVFLFFFSFFFNHFSFSKRGSAFLLRIDSLMYWPESIMEYTKLTPFFVLFSVSHLPAQHSILPSAHRVHVHRHTCMVTVYTFILSFCLYFSIPFSFVHT